MMRSSSVSSSPQTQVIPPRPRRIYELDALRGIAALSVVCYHYTTRYDQIYGHTTPLALSIPAGRYGVLLFFIISGFVILMSLDRTQRAQDFVTGRILRLYPTYWVAIAITFTVVTLAGLPGREVTVTDALWNGLMIHPFWGIPDVDGVYWTLLVELIFYLIMVGIYSLGWLHRIEWIGLSWLVINGLEDHNLLIEIPERLEPWFILGYAHLFILGITLYRLWRMGGSPLRYGLIAACLSYQVILYPEWDKNLVVFLTVGALLLSIAGRLRAIAIPPLLALGAISYPLYLTHQNVGYVIIRGLQQQGVGAELSIAVSMGVAIALAALMTYAIERPVMAWSKQLRHIGPRDTDGPKQPPLKPSGE